VDRSTRGDTPLVPAPTLSERTGCEVWLKLEGLNPTGSFKDRGMTVAVSAALEEGAEAVICASTGNTAASAGRVRRPWRACARGGDRPGGQDRDRQAGPGAHATEPASVALRGNFDQALELVRQVVERHPIAAGELA